MHVIYKGGSVMPNYTEKYNLQKPLGTEEIDIEVLNKNFDKIDKALTAQNAKIEHSQYSASNPFDGSLTRTVLAEIDASAVCAMADMIICRHISSNQAVIAKANICFYYNNGEPKTKITLAETYGTHYSSENVQFTIYIVYHQLTNKYYIAFSPRNTSSLNLYDYTITGLNINPITPFKIATSELTNINYALVGAPEYNDEQETVSE